MNNTLSFYIPPPMPINSEIEVDPDPVREKAKKILHVVFKKQIHSFYYDFFSTPNLLYLKSQISKKYELTVNDDYILEYMTYVYLYNAPNTDLNMLNKITLEIMDRYFGTYAIYERQYVADATRFVNGEGGYFRLNPQRAHYSENMCHHKQLSLLDTIFGK
jgi:hypothetical protein